MPRYTLRSSIPVSAEALFDWHLRFGAIDRLTPPWEQAEVVDRGGGVAEGSRATVRVKTPLGWKDWVAEHRGIVPGREFEDVQISGPFGAWVHHHRMIPEGPDACVYEDDVEYQLPMGPVGALFGAGIVRTKLDRMFAYRHRVVRADLAAHGRYDGPPLRVLVSGATGLVGKSLSAFLTTGGHTVIPLGRAGTPARTETSVKWNPEVGPVEVPHFSGFDAVVHLAGESVAGSRWTPERKRRIRDSRLIGTRRLCEALAQAEVKPKVLVCASAIGYYGDRGDEILGEEAGPGTGLLPEVCVEWERATDPARNAGIRVVKLRIGVVLSPLGGALATMLPVFNLGGGGVLGDGRQYMPCIALDDLVYAIHHSLVTPDLAGPVNGVCPEPTTNRTFTKTLGRVIGRPTILPVPKFGARLALGELADALLFASTRVVPNRLLASGFSFAYPTLEASLRHVLGRELRR